MFHFPIHNWHSATVHGAVDKHVTCESCNGQFAYVLERAATGSALNVFNICTDRFIHERATRRAAKNLTIALEHEEDFVACPTCGWYQTSMVRAKKRRRFRNVLGVLVIGFF